MVFLRFSEVEQRIAQAYVLKIVFGQGSNIFSSFDVIAHGLLNHEGLFHISKILGDGLSVKRFIFHAFESVLYLAWKMM